MVQTVLLIRAAVSVWIKHEYWDNGTKKPPLSAAYSPFTHTPPGADHVKIKAFKMQVFYN